MNNLQYDTLLNIYQNNRKLIEDIKAQYINLLLFLTNTPDIPTEEFIDKIYEISKIGDIIICYFTNGTEFNEDIKINIIGSGTVIYEPKIIHGCASVGHIEDIVVHKNYRSNGVAKNILNRLIDMAKNNNCYKVILDCKHELVNFYEMNGFKNNGNQMSKYF